MLLVIKDTKKRTPSWSVKVDHDGVLRYISLSVIMDGGAEENLCLRARRPSVRSDLTPI